MNNILQKFLVHFVWYCSEQEQQRLLVQQLLIL